MDLLDLDAPAAEAPGEAWADFGGGLVDVDAPQGGAPRGLGRPRVAGLGTAFDSNDFFEADFKSAPSSLPVGPLLSPTKRPLKLSSSP